MAKWQKDKVAKTTAMKIIRFIIVLLVITSAAFATFFILKSDSTLLTHPKGVIARDEFHLMLTNVFHMLIVIVPTYILLFVVAWKYRAKNSSKLDRSQAEYDPDKSPGIFGELILWIIPSIIVASMATITWDATHDLDPYRPLKSEVKPLQIQVVALNWKWLFIYPEQGIATVNFVQFPERTPVHFSLAADGSPMNSFWIPQLSGQIYAMTGMVTPLYIMADGPGVYAGKAAEINGQGYADMVFVAKSTSQSNFDSWIVSVKQSPLQLTNNTYNELLRPSENNPTTLYSSVEEGLFNKVVLKYMHPMHPTHHMYLNHMDSHMEHKCAH
ncbi:MAG: COX aromatic rich motif-containing protein [Oligoflexia bacterium]|nr:COX aromatic rich motif-containing protein [Oligoflexia bacterium]